MTDGPTPPPRRGGMGWLWIVLIVVIGALLVWWWWPTADGDLDEGDVFEEDIGMMHLVEAHPVQLG